MNQKAILLSGLYYLYDKVWLVYIGKSINVFNRIPNHTDKEFMNIRIKGIKSGLLISFLEVVEIDKYRPKYNKQLVKPDLYYLHIQAYIKKRNINIKFDYREVYNMNVDEAINRYDDILYEYDKTGISKAVNYTAPPVEQNKIIKLWNNAIVFTYDLIFNKIL